MYCARSIECAYVTTSSNWFLKGINMNMNLSMWFKCNIRKGKASKDGRRYIIYWKVTIWQLILNNDIQVWWVLFPPPLSTSLFFSLLFIYRRQLEKKKYNKVIFCFVRSSSGTSSLKKKRGKPSFTNIVFKRQTPRSQMLLLLCMYEWTD